MIYTCIKKFCAKSVFDLHEFYIIPCIRFFLLASKIASIFRFVRESIKIVKNSMA